MNFILAHITNEWKILLFPKIKIEYDIWFGVTVMIIILWGTLKLLLYL